MEYSLRNIITERLSSSVAIAKIPLCLLVSFSALFGYAFYGSIQMEGSVALFISMLLLSCGGASFNSFQERRTDGLMQRTCRRPMATGSLSPSHGFIQGGLLSFAGLFLILITLNIEAFVAGLSALVLYNLVYTILKSKTVYAIIPGAISGALPPYIGWVAAGGDVLTYKAILPFLLLVFWQIPHFFLILLNHRDDYLSGVLPNLLSYFTEKALKRVFIVWIVALVVVMLIFSVTPMPLGLLGKWTIVFNGALLLGLFVYQVFCTRNSNYRFMFTHLNIALFIHMFVVIMAAIGNQI